MLRHTFWIFTSLCATTAGFSETIEEKLASSLESQELSISGIEQFNAEMGSLRDELVEAHQMAEELHQEQADEEEYLALIELIKALRQKMNEVEKKWHESLKKELERDEEGYALWDQDEMTLQQLILEYGPSDCLYIVPPEIGAIKLNIHTSIPIPRESWKDILEILLIQNGIGTKVINSYTKQLYILKQEPFTLQTVVTKPEELMLIPAQTRVFYVFTPPPEQTRSVLQFLEKFADPKISLITQVGIKIAVVSSREEVLKLLDIYQAMWHGTKGKVAKVIPISKMPVKEMERILQSFFGESLERPKSPFVKAEQEGLSVIAPASGNVIVLIGNEEIVRRAEKMVKDTMDQLQDPSEMTVFLYTCRHSNPEDLAKVLEKVYASLLGAGDSSQEAVDITYTSRSPLPPPAEGYPGGQPLIVPPPSFKPDVTSRFEVDQGSDHFIADVKTGNLLMVVRRSALGKIKEILRKLDVPKRMVQIEVLLFEKKLNSQSNFGLNLLKIGSSKHGARYDGPVIPKADGLKSPVGRGVVEFLFSNKKSKGFPAFDLAYSFLMTQEDIQLNASPSVITVNQTPTTISVTEEISINSGAAPIDTNKGIAYEKAFTRAQYGITIIVTPIVHLPDTPEEMLEGKGFVTLQTNITFDTTKPHADERPTVDKRHIENEVRVVDGQTIILGGLRKKATQDSQERIPLLGEIPGLGKLFGSTSLIDNNTEMFIFITPKIIQDPKEELDRIRLEELKKRPGDMPEFLEKMVEARNAEKKKYFINTMKMFFKNDG